MSRTTLTIVMWLAAVAGGHCGMAGEAFGSGGAQEGRAAGDGALSFRGRVFHSASGKVSDLRFIEVPGGSVMLVWDELERRGRRSYFAISRDGERIDQVMETENLVRLQRQSFDPLAGVPRVPEGLAAREDNELYLVQFVGTPLEGMRAEIEANGGSVKRFLTDNTHVVRMDARTREAVGALPYVRWVGAYHPAYRLDGAVFEAEGDAGARRYGIELMDAGLGAQQAVADAIVGQWGGAGGIVDRVVHHGFRMEATLTLEQVIELAHRNDVNFIDPWQAPGMHVNIARQMSGATPTLANAGFLGQGVRGEVIDSGIQMNHPEWSMREPILHRAVNSAGSIHGTAVYGIVFSTGVDQQAQGFLPQHEAGVFGHFMEMASTSQGRLGWFLETVDPNGPYRAVFQNNSWGQGQTTTYTTVTAEIDHAVFLSGLLMLQSQANNNSQVSAVEAWAKNVVSVGGIQHGNQIDPLTHTRSGASIGYAADGRVKPELAHFYDMVYTTVPTSSYTASFGGTSAAAPLTAGGFGLIKQMWHEGVFDGFGGGSSVFDSRPHFSTAKAMAIAGAYRYNWTGGTAANASLTRPVQGWGVVDVAHLHAKRERMFIVDATDPVENAQSQVYMLTVDPGEPRLLVSMAYSDPPGTPAAAQARINDLDLKVTSPGGAVYWGNHALRSGNWSVPGGSATSIDTVENVFVLDPEPGVWTVEVIGTQVIADTTPALPGVQANFGLAVIGAVAGPPPALLMSFPGLPVFVDPGEPLEVVVTILDNAQTLVPGSARAHVRTDGAGVFSEIPLAAAGSGMYRAVLPGFSCGDEPEVYFSAQGHLGETVVLPRLAPQLVYTTGVGAVVQSTLMHVNFGSTVPAGWEATGLWHMSTNRCIPGGVCDGASEWWAYYGRLFACNYQTTGRTMGALTTPEIELPALPPDGRIILTFCSALETENSMSYDRAEVYINQDMVLRIPESASWTVHQIDLTDYAGQTARIAWNFDSIDGNNNSFRGWQVNNIRLTADTVMCANPCYANCDGSTVEPVLNVDDFTCFINEFAAAQGLPHVEQVGHYANCDGSAVPPVLNVDDFTCFINAFAAGCR